VLPPSRLLRCIVVTFSLSIQRASIAQEARQRLIPGFMACRLRMHSPVQGSGSGEGTCMLPASPQAMPYLKRQL
jgi:hypothetical protein